MKGKSFQAHGTRVLYCIFFLALFGDIKLKGVRGKGAYFEPKWRNMDTHMEKKTSKTKMGNERPSYLHTGGQTTDRRSTCASHRS